MAGESISVNANLIAVMYVDGNGTVIKFSKELGTAVKESPQTIRQMITHAGMPKVK